MERKERNAQTSKQTNGFTSKYFGLCSFPYYIACPFFVHVPGKPNVANFRLGMNRITIHSDGTLMTTRPFSNFWSYFYFYNFAGLLF